MSHSLSGLFSQSIRATPENTKRTASTLPRHNLFYIIAASTYERGVGELPRPSDAKLTPWQFEVITLSLCTLCYRKALLPENTTVWEHYYLNKLSPVDLIVWATRNTLFGLSHDVTDGTRHFQSWKVIDL
ncbi:hypothetical protein N7447_001828 [Penicillium robsamsonii]|uniref:uncharacterized protein n=1 Tax=Penicillium robsamsonii TaxID=1792511 RepID=UPI002548ADF7|nr:uncharacterized protein N7447_001828 [Penicillium robsamsonii]KAJ5835802.1 hypothetical protein N7447_001828 [Penicillium robsamsonii]